MFSQKRIGCNSLLFKASDSYGHRNHGLKIVGNEEVSSQSLLNFSEGAYLIVLEAKD